LTNGRKRNGIPPSVGYRALAASVVDRTLAASAAARTRTDPDHSPTVEPCGGPAYGRLPLTFVKNQGSSTSGLSSWRGDGAVTTYCTGDGFVLQLVTRERQEGMEEDCVTGVNVFFTFEGATLETQVQGREELPGRFHYFRGQNPAQWHTDVPTYQRIHYKELYPGIDLELREGEPGRSSMTVLMPGADLASVRVRC
jgi:hypothetical protein